MKRANKGPRTETHPTADGNGGNLLWIHPAWRPDLPSKPGPSIENLRGESEVFRAMGAALSLMVFAFRENRRLGPAPERWDLSSQGLPVLACEADVTEADFESEMRRLLESFRNRMPGKLGGKCPRGSGEYGTGLRRSLVNEWFRRALPEEGPLPSSESLLGELWRLWNRASFKPEISSPHGLGVLWKSSMAPLRGGLFRWRATAGLHRELSLRAAKTGGLPGGPWKVVHLEEAPPFPFASLEPLLASALDSPAEARDRMRSLFSKGGRPEAELRREILELLGGSDIPGWLLTPGERLDPQGLAVLEEVAAELDKPLAVLGECGDPFPGEVARIHFLWLPPTASEWYSRHLGSLLGPSPMKWLTALDLLPADEPRPGSTLLPPVRVGEEGPWSSFLGGKTPRKSKRQRPRKVHDDESCAALARECRLADLHAAANGLPHGEVGRFWKGVVSLLLGQAHMAEESWRGLEDSAELKGRLPLYRARVLERRQLYGEAAEVLGKIKEKDLPPWDRPWLDLLRGQYGWLSGKTKVGGAFLEKALKQAPDSDWRAQAHCHLAILALHCNDPEGAMDHLGKASEIPETELFPLTRYLLLQRRGLLQRKMGKYDRALDLFVRAGDLAGTHGLRWLELGALLDMGNACRILSRLEEAEEAYGRCVEGAAGLGLQSIGEQARFDLGITLLERGSPMGAQAIFETATPDREGGTTPQESAVEAYWLGAALQQMGKFPQALEWAEKGIATGIRDPSVLLPLHFLRGEILHLSGQGRKLSRLVTAMETALSPHTEAQDRLCALILRVLSEGSSPEAFAALESQAGKLLPDAASEFHCLWHLAAAAVRRDGCSDHLKEALEASRSLPSPYLLCRTLLQMKGASSLPRIESRERERCLGFLQDNRVQGPLLNLMPHLVGVPEGPGRAPVGQSNPDDLSLLELSASGAPESLGLILGRLGASAGCLILPGRPSRAWGKASDRDAGSWSLRAGEEGVFRVSGGTMLGVQGSEGAWCGFLRSRPASAWTRDEIRLAQLWTRLFTPSPRESLPRKARPRHPAIERLLLTRSPAMDATLDLIHKASSFGFPVLLTGESGVGKEVCAMALHAAGKPRSPFIPTNCANLTPTLAASLLFGHRRGAFTGADRDQEGLVEAARGGVLFLDEIGELPMETQAQLLRFLQDGSYVPLGHTRPRASDARILAASNRDLEEAAAKGLFRFDLFQRLNVVRIDIPPLRNRPEDIPLLFDLFLKRAAEEEGCPLPSVEGKVLTRLAVYSWPGNVRELQNLARALLVASHGEAGIRLDHLPGVLLEGEVKRSGPRSLRDKVQAFERTAVKEALARHAGNRSSAAKELGISRQALSQKIRKLGIRL